MHFLKLQSFVEFFKTNTKPKYGLILQIKSHLRLSIGYKAKIVFKFALQIIVQKVILSTRCIFACLFLNHSEDKYDFF